MLPPNQSNTIDFDTAKLQRLGFAGKRRTPLRPLNVSQLRQQLNLMLQTSLELERILEVFLREARRLIPLDALAYQMAASDLRLELGERALHSVSYHLNHDGDYLGELIFRRGRRFSNEELAQLESLLSSLLFPLRNALLYRTALQNSLRDPLTGTGNRIAMEQTLQREIHLARRNLQPLSVLMLDIDHFKRINDTHGHAAGDQVLRAVADTLKAQVRNVDMVFRYGGEEFLILLSNTGLEAAALVGERLRQAVRRMHLQHQQPGMDISASLGCACLQPGEALDDLLRRADDALYAAKRAGRDRLSLAASA